MARIGFGILALLVLGLTSSAQAAWRTTNFEVSVSRPNPDGTNWEDLEDRGRRLAVNQEEILKMERFLQDVAREYASMGFSYLP